MRTTGYNNTERTGPIILIHFDDKFCFVNEFVSSSSETDLKLKYQNQSGKILLYFE